MSTAYRQEPETQALFSHADALYNSAKTKLSIGDLLHAPHDEVERYAMNMARQILQALIQDHLCLRGFANACGPVVGIDGEERKHVRLDAGHRLVTTVGDVHASRPAHEGRPLSALHPVDAELNWPKTVYSFEVQRQLARTSAEVSFQRAVELFFEYTGVRVGLRQVEQISRSAACDMEEFYQQTDRGFQGVSSSDMLIGSVDQKGIVMLCKFLLPATKKKADAAKPKLESRLTKGENHDRKRMSTVAAVYTIAPHVRSADDVISGLRHLQVAGPRIARPRPESKRVWASVELSLSDVVLQLFDEFDRRDPQRSKNWIIVVDGDKKLERSIRKEAKSRGAKVTLVLDFIHALEYLWRAGHALCEEATPELEAWVLDRLKLLLEGKVSTVVAGMRRSATFRSMSAEQRKPIEKAANYLLKRKHMMLYPEMLALGAPIASGVIEGTCRSLVNDRMDLTGARWSVLGAEAVLRLRSILRSGDWDEYWSFHTAREYSRNHASLYANGQPPAVEIPRRLGQLRRIR